jgi:hypothetical protein
MESELFETTEIIKNIDVIDIEVVSECEGLCSPENYFEQIEKCKVCGKLV